MSEVRMVWKGQVSAFLDDDTRLIDVEGAFRCGKTTAALWKVFNSCMAHPGIHWLVCRYSDDDTRTKLKPPWREILRACQVDVRWDAKEKCDVFPNGTSNPEDPYAGGSRVFVFGIKSQDQVSRYGKLRGLTLSGVYNDQTEELPKDIYLELVGRLSQKGFKHQMILTPNPPDENHWLCDEFPEANNLKGRKYYSIPIYANAHNLPEEAITGLEGAYPPSHPKHRSAILGKRGLNVIGKPVYGGEPEKGIPPVFQRALHLRALAYNPKLPLLESIDFGKHHPCVVWGQYTPYGQCLLLGGILGQDLYLEEDFIPVVQQHRSQWFPNALSVQTCCDPAGSHDASQGLRENGVDILRKHDFAPRWKDNSNAPDVRLAMIERLAGYMRRRTVGGEAFGVESDPEKWLLISSRYVKPWPFVADALEAGYVWDEHYVSIGSKQVRKPKKDGWYEHGMNCLEYLEHNHGGAQPSMEQVERHASKVHAQALRRAQQDRDPYRWSEGATSRRGGY